ncbi:hypothetical protein Tco_0670853 [Tanacetum coccineum]
METQKPLLKDEDGEEVEVHMYRYQVHLQVSHLQDVKVIFRFISWQCKKQTVVANSTTEAECVGASSCYGQVLWIQNQQLDYGFVTKAFDLYLILLGKAKKSVKLMMEKLFGMELELMLVTQS